MLRFCEEIGLPFVLNNITIAKSQATGAVKRIAKYSSYWALVTMLRVGDQEIIDSLYDRKALAHLTFEQVDEQAIQFIGLLNRCKPFIEDKNLSFAPNLAVRIAQVVPEILSRLCTKCSVGTLDRILDLLKELYQNPRKCNYKGVNNLVARILESIPVHHLYRNIQRLLEIPVVAEQDPLTSREYPDPFAFFKIGSFGKASSSRIHLDSVLVDSLILMAKSCNPSERDRACLRLFHVYEADLLDDTQINHFVDALWSQCGGDGFPEHVHLYRSAYLKGLHPIEVDPVALFRQYVKNTSFPIHSTSGRQGISMTGGDCPICVEIVGATKRPLWGGVIEWSQDEIIALFNRLVAWWNADKEYLKQNERPLTFVSIPDEFHARFRHLVTMIADVVAPGLSSDTNGQCRATLSRMLNEFDEYEVPSLYARAACLHVFPDDRDLVCSRICDAIISSSDHRKLSDAIRAVYAALRTYENVDAAPAATMLLDSVGQQIKWRRQVALVNSLNMMADIAEKMPQLLSESLLSDVLTGLDHLRKESDVTGAEPDADIAGMLANRQFAAFLAYTLFRHFSETGKDVPGVILDWQTICRSPNEFAEVRNQWREDQ